MLDEASKDTAAAAATTAPLESPPALLALSLAESSVSFCAFSNAASRAMRLARISSSVRTEVCCMSSLVVVCPFALGSFAPAPPPRAQLAISDRKPLIVNAGLASPGVGVVVGCDVVEL